MKNFCITALFLLLTSFAFAQGAYTSLDNKKSNWETASIWTKQFSGMEETPSSTDVGGDYVVNIYGAITRNGNISFTGGSTLNVYDTLVIKGNFTVASSVVVHPGGVLIVLGNFTGTSSASAKLVNNGNVVITGEFSNSGGSITTNNKVYSFDTTPTFSWGASIDGVAYNGSNTSTMGNELRNKADLTSANSSLSGFVNNLLGILPIKLLSFTGLTNDNIVVLTWVTAKEEGFSHFEIEHASDDLVFGKIAHVNGSGYNTNDEHTYSVTDEKPIIGTNYYRLKSVDIDGSYAYSPIISAVVETSRSISVYPNPSTGYFINVATNFELGENTQVMIFSQEGTMLHHNNITERETRIDFINRLTSGVYILKYTSAAYSQTVKLFVK